jgi:hypothetical protein
MAEISMDIVNDAGRLIHFHGELRKTNPIYELQGIFSAWKQRFQAILSMMAENLSDFTTNSEKLTQFTKVRGIFSASKQRIQATFTTVAVNVKQYFYTNGRNSTRYLQ